MQIERGFEPFWGSDVHGVFGFVFVLAFIAVCLKMQSKIERISPMQNISNYIRYW